MSKRRPNNTSEENNIKGNIILYVLYLVIIIDISILFIKKIISNNIFAVLLLILVTSCMLYYSFKFIQSGINALWQNNNKWYKLVGGYVLACIGISLFFTMTYTLIAIFSAGNLQYGACIYDSKGTEIINNNMIVTNSGDIMRFSASNFLNSGSGDICPTGFNKWMVLINKLCGAILITIIIGIAIARSRWSNR